MIVIAFIEDGTVEVFDSAARAATRFDGLDVESGTVRCFAADGTPLAVGFGASAVGAEGARSARRYALVPARDPALDTLALAFFEARELVSNALFDSLDSLKSSLRAAGVAVDHDAPGVMHDD